MGEYIFKRFDLLLSKNKSRQNSIIIIETLTILTFVAMVTWRTYALSCSRVTWSFILTVACQTTVWTIPPGRTWLSTSRTNISIFTRTCSSNDMTKSTIFTLTNLITVGTKVSFFTTYKIKNVFKLHIKEKMISYVTVAYIIHVFYVINFCMKVGRLANKVVYRSDKLYYIVLVLVKRINSNNYDNFNQDTERLKWFSQYYCDN